MFSRTWRIPLATTTLDRRTHGLGGWGVDGHHLYDPNGKVLQQGNGRRRTPRSLSPVITRVAGTDSYGEGLDGTLAINAQLAFPTGIAVGPDGSLYIADTANNRIRRVKPDGTIVTVAGTNPIPPPPTGELREQRALHQTAQAVTEALRELMPPRPSAGQAALLADDDGGPATAAQLANPQAVALGPDGSLYIADTDHHRIRRVSPNGIISTVAGTGTAGFSGDGGLATEAEIFQPQGLAVDTYGALYIADTVNHRIRRVGPDGIIHTLAGNGDASFSGDGGPATEAPLWYPSGVAVGKNGDVYIADTINNRVRRVNTAGIISTVAGTETGGFNGDGMLATAANLSLPRGLGLGRDGTLYLADEGNGRIRHLTGDGLITTVAGGGEVGVNVEGSPATASVLSSPAAVAVGPEGVLYVANTFDHRILRVAPPLPGFSLDEISVASEDGSELDVFNPAGRHLRTVNTVTGAVRTQFGYDSAGRLIQITDGDGNVTIIERSAQGVPVAIVSPYGQRTTLAVNSDGYLATITTPANETTSFTYTPTGLMTGMTTPRGQVYQYTYDSTGRLLRDTDPAGGFTALARTGSTGNYEVTKTTAGGRVKRYQGERRADAKRRRTAIGADGTERAEMIGQDGTRTRTGADGMVTATQQSPDPRFGMLAPLGASSSVTTPGGLTATMTTERTTTLSDPNNILSLSQQTDTTTRNGRVTTRVYDATTRTATTTSPENRQTATTVDSQGRVTTIEVPGIATTQIGYDARGRVSTLGQGARTSAFTYDPNGYLARVTDPLARVVSFERDAVGRVTSQTLPDGREIQFTYDANGNATSIMPPGRDAHSFTFTPVDLLDGYGAPFVSGGGTNVTTYAYNLDRQLTTITRPDGQQVGLGYDSAGRLSTQTSPTGQSVYSYHATTGKLSTLTAPGGETLSYSYDGSLPTSTTWTGPIAGSVEVTYDPDFRVTEQRVNGGNTMPFTYDLDSLLTGAGDLTLNRNAQNGLLTGTSLGSVSDTITYTPFAEPSAYEATVNASAVFRQQYTRDDLGRITTKMETAQGVTDSYGYTYDLAGRLTEVQLNGLTLTTYAYDSNGNRLSKTSPSGSTTYTYDAQDRLLTQAPVSGPASIAYTYSANGELSTVTRSPSPVPVSYSYDVLGNLLAATLPNGTQIEYVIDGQDRRVGKKVNGTLVQGFLYQNQLNPVAELDGTGAMVSRFVYASKGNVPDYLLKGSETYRIINDHLGSPRLVVNTTTGAVVQRMDYDEFGQVITDTNPGFQPFGFAGGLYDRDTKLVRFGARDYDAETGRWTVKDPILFAGGDTNLYGYVLGDPVNLIDPTGLCGQNPCDYPDSDCYVGCGCTGQICICTRTVCGRIVEIFRAIITNNAVPAPHMRLFTCSEFDSQIARPPML